MRRPSPATVRRLILVLILALWELVPRTGLLAELFLPSLSKTLTVLAQNWEEYARDCDSAGLERNEAMGNEASGKTKS